MELYDVVQNYMKTLMARHPVASSADANTLLLARDFASSGAAIPAPPPGTDMSAGGDMGSANSPWAKTSGPFRELYARELSGAKPLPPMVGPGPNGEQPQQAADNLAGNFGGPIDAFVRDRAKGSSTCTTITSSRSSSRCM